MKRYAPLKLIHKLLVLKILNFRTALVVSTATYLREFDTYPT